MSKTPSRLVIAVFITIAAAIILLAHAVLYAALTVIFAMMPAAASTALASALAVLAIGFIAVSILSMRYDNVFVRASYSFFAVWMGFFVYLFLASALSVIVGARFGIGLMTIATIAGIYGLFHARSIKIKRLRILLPHLPSSWQGRKAIFIADVHLGHVHGAGFSAKVAAIIQNESPDLVMIGGDLYDGVKVDENAIVAPFAGLTPLLGTYFVTGNHEEFQDSGHFIRAIERAGIKILDNELTEIDSLQLIGVTDRDSTDKKRFPEILAGLKVDRTKPSILLKHQPSGLAAAESSGVSLQLSGHTHRAQQWPFMYITHWIFKSYDYGLKRFGQMQVYTTSGVGTWGPPLRVGTDAEIVVLEFVAASSDN